MCVIKYFWYTAVPTITQGPQSISYLQGRDANFSCSANGIPSPTILWTFTNNSNVATTHRSDRNYYSGINVTGELDLLDVAEDDFGTYTCIAVNIFDTDTKVATLVLKSGKFIVCNYLSYCCS